MQSINRILVIRGGAIGDFILTLPALKALRDAHPKAHLEILGYKHIAALAENRFYAQSVRSIEYGPLSSFFARNGELSEELSNYFASFDLILTYLFDPDEIFETNLRRCGVEEILRGPAKIEHQDHASRQLARPLKELGVEVTDLAARISPSEQDRQFARDLIGDLPRPIIAIHPGSGSEQKNWPLENWIELIESLLAENASRSGGLRTADLPKRRSGDRRSLVLIAGEADQPRIERLERQLKGSHVLWAKNLPLPQLAAVLEDSIFIGHDSGISHLAAAVNAKCVLLFGPTNPEVWAPQNAEVQIVRATGARMEDIFLQDVIDAVTTRLSEQ